MEALQRVGRSVTSQLDLDGILTTVVDAAVELTGAGRREVCSCWMKPAGNCTCVPRGTFKMILCANSAFLSDDTLPGQVMRTGKPIAINELTPQKIKTAYLVHTLIYFPFRCMAG